MLLISLFRCCIFFSRISCTKHKSEYSFKVNLPAPGGRSHPSSASVSFPWSTHFSSSPPPFASESLSYFSDSPPSRYSLHSTTSLLSIDSIMQERFSLPLSLIDFSSDVRPPQPPWWPWTDPCAGDPPRSAAWPAWPTPPSAWSPESSSTPSSPPSWAAQYDSPAALRRRQLSSCWRGFPSRHLWPLRLLRIARRCRSSLGHRLGSILTAAALRTFVVHHIIIEDAPVIMELAGSSQVTQRPLVTSCFPYLSIYLYKTNLLDFIRISLILHFESTKVSSILLINLLFSNLIYRSKK